MQRVGSGRNPALDKFGTGKHGFTAGNPQAGVPATTPGAELFDSWQEEMCAVVEGAGIVLDSNKRNQMLTAIQTMLRDQLATAFTSAGTASAYTLTPSPALVTLAAGSRYRVKFLATNSGGGSTLSVSGLAAKSIRQYDSSGAKVAAIIKTGQLADVEYDGSDWVIVDPLPAGIAASSVQTFTTSGTLPASVVGGTALINSASSTTQTLPAANTVSAGARIELLNIGAGIAAISRAGTDMINPNGTTVSSMALGPGDTLTLESNGSNGWYAVGGSAHLGYADAFGASRAQNGYQRLPGGLILQWALGAVASGATITFPLTFPNAVLRCNAFHEGGNASLATGCGVPTRAGVPVYHASGTLPQTIGILAIGI